MVFAEGDPKNDLYPHMRDYTSFLKKMERPLVGREKEQQQLMAAMARPELCNAILLGEAGSGKSLENGTEIPGLFESGYREIQDIRPGDFVFDEEGQPTEVLGVFPQGLRHAYRVVFSDGTTVVCNNEHLWSARTRKQHYDDRPYSVHTLQDMMDYGILHTRLSKKRPSMRLKNWYVPCNMAVERPEASLPVHPYVIGALIGDGCLTSKGALEFSSCDEFVVRKVASLIGSSEVRPHKGCCSWLFSGSSAGFDHRNVHVADLLADPMFECMSGKKSVERRIPRPYLRGSIEQRMQLLQGLMDTDGTVTGNDRTSCSYSTNNPGLVDDVRELAASLGIRTTMNRQERFDDIHQNPEYEVHFILPDDRKSELFSLPRHLEKISRYARSNRRFNKRFGDIAIAGVEDLGYESEMTCIYVAAPSHLFQVGRAHIVTHNTALVQGTMLKDPKRAYLEVDLPKMISNLKNENEMADKLKQLFREVEQFRRTEGKEIVLFIDEFHQIVQLSAAAVEVLKPMLADSGTRGIRVIAATTYVEFQEYISSNLPLVERLQRINLVEPDQKVVVSILRGMAERYGVAGQFGTDAMFESIYEYTNRYIPANAQPRKSILMLDSMIGWHRLTGAPMDMKMLSNVIYDTEGINIAFRVDASKIKEELDKRVLSQDFATSAIESRLQICVADLNNKNRPMSSFLFTGSTGTGKSTVCSARIPVWTKDGSVSWKQAGDVVPGDYVFDREGHPTKVLGVFPQGKRDVYRVTFADGRYLDVSDNHLWAVCPAKRARDEGFTIYTTQTLLNKGIETRHHDRVGMKYFVPMNQPVQWPARDFTVDPYVVGAMIGDGSLSARPELCISSDDEFVVEKIAGLIGAARCKTDRSNYDWCFKKSGKNVQQKDIFGGIPELYHVKSPERRIPRQYMTGSVEQRWALVNGLFDTDGCIGQCDGGRYNISYSTHSRGLAYDVQELLYSLGVSSSVKSYDRERDGVMTTDYELHVCSRNADKWRFFTLPRRLDIAKRAATVNKQREKTFDYLGIRSIEKLGYQDDMVCFYVDNDEHLYQAGDFIVTHNTETTKQLANILFQDERALCRFDMTEYALPESLERFRQELTTAVWTKPYCILLMDEIEKACAPVTRILLQVLDDGRLLDRNNREVTFKNAYIIITTNAGSEIYKTIAQYSVDDTGSGKMMEKYESLIRDSIKGTTGGNKFPPELLGRIDCLVPFQPLSEKTMADICQMKLMQLRENIKKKHHITVSYDSKLIRYIVQDKMTTDSDAGGARGIVSRIEREVTTELARFINQHPEFRAGRTMYVCVEGELAVDDKNRLESAGHVVVRDKPPKGDVIDR